MLIFKPIFNWVLKYHKNYQHIKSMHMFGYGSFGRFLDGVCEFEGKFGWVMSFLEKKLHFLLPRSRVLIMTSPLYNYSYKFLYKIQI